MTLNLPVPPSDFAQFVYRSISLGYTKKLDEFLRSAGVTELNAHEYSIRSKQLDSATTEYELRRGDSVVAVAHVELIYDDGDEGFGWTIKLQKR